MSRRPLFPRTGGRRRPVRKDQGLFRMARRVVGALVVVGLLAAGWAAWTYGGRGPSAAAGAASTDIVLPKGAGVNQIAAALKRQGLIGSRTVFVVAARLTGAARRLKAGEYEFRSGASTSEILADIAAGKVVRRFVVVPEGWTSQMAADAVRAEPALTGTVETPPEGSLLPDGYQIQRGEDRTVVMQRMRQARDTVLAQLWAARAPDIPLQTPEQAVTLASIVEKETGLPAERPRVAAVFENRLRIGMALQSDPTIIYGLTQGRPLGHGITRSELDRETPYNTYKIKGLPPGPIANPGRASLAAVLNPPTSDELYFVADGTGGHAFASTSEQHVVNVERWHALERARAAGGPAK